MESKLREAKDLIHERGWFQAGKGRDATTHCMVTALSALHHDRFHNMLADFKVLAKVTEDQFPERRLPHTKYSDDLSPNDLERNGWQIAYCNDHSLTTLDDVDMLLEKAAVLREEEI